MNDQFSHAYGTTALRPKSAVKVIGAAAHQQTNNLFLIRPESRKGDMSTLVY